MNSEMKQQLELEWRRNKVLELSSEGYSEREIGSKLQISHITVHRDLTALKKQAQQSLEHHIHEVVPMEYQRCMTGMKQTLKQVIEIGNTVSDPKVKLEARRIANDCYRYIMDLCTNAGIVNEALKFVTSQKQKIDTLQKVDERIEAIEEEEAEETTTNGVF